MSPVEKGSKPKKPEEKKKEKKPEKKPEKKVEKPAKEEKKVVAAPKPVSTPSPAASPKTGPKPGKAAIAYSAGKDSGSASSSPAPVRSAPASNSSEVVKGGLNSTTYEKQPDWAFSERSKNANGQYRDGQFQGSDNPNNASRPTVSSTTSSPKPAAASSSPSWSPKPATTSYSKPATTTSSYAKPTTTTTTSPSPKPAALSYRAGGDSNATSSYGANNGANNGSQVVKSGLHQTTYEKQPDWAYAEKSKNSSAQYADSMFQKSSSNVSYGSSSASPSQLRAGGHLR